MTSAPQAPTPRELAAQVWSDVLKANSHDPVSDIERAILSAVEAERERCALQLEGVRERCARIIEDNVSAISVSSHAEEHVLRPRTQGNITSLPYAAAIRALPLPPSQIGEKVNRLVEAAEKYVTERGQRDGWGQQEIALLNLITALKGFGGRNG